MRAGDLTNKIDLEAKVRTPDDMGGFTTSWRAVATGIWASVWPLKAEERVNANQQQGVATLRVRIRFRRGVRADWRINLGSGRYLAICSQPIDLGNRHEELEMLCKEVAS